MLEYRLTCEECGSTDNTVRERMDGISLILCDDCYESEIDIFDDSE